MDADNKKSIDLILIHHPPETYVQKVREKRSYIYILDLTNVKNPCHLCAANPMSISDQFSFRIIYIHDIISDDYLFNFLFDIYYIFIITSGDNNPS